MQDEFPKKVRLIPLYETYAPLLTEKQRMVTGLWLEEDLSLGEIASETGTTRQAVNDMLKKAQRFLIDMEDKLGLADKLFRQEALLDKMKEAGSVEQLRRLAEQLEQLWEE